MKPKKYKYGKVMHKINNYEQQIHQQLEIQP